MGSLNYIEVSKNSLLHNFDVFKRNAKNKMCAVVKGNAYGHGIREVVEVLDSRVDYFQVDDFLELLELRKYTNKKALVLGYVSSDELPKLNELNAIPGLYNVESINNYHGEYHLKIDALLGRQGVLTTDIDQFIKNIQNRSLTGVYTHFSNIEDVSFPDHYKRQIKDFKKALGIIQSYGHRDFDIHINSTAGSLVNNELNTTITRLGIGLYGMWPSEDLQARYENKIGKIKPVMRWVSHVAQVKSLPENYPIGYGLTYITDRPTKIAIIPQGYSDGYDRGLSNKGVVIIRDTYCSVLGRVAMNMFAVDVTRLNDVKPHDEVILLGKSTNTKVSAEELAYKVATINYEITTRVSPLLPRILV